MNQAAMPATFARVPVLARVVIALYFVSGLVGISYQVLWARMLSLQFGISIFGVVITAAAFMLGLGGGALQGSRLAKQLNKPLRWFALFEGAVAVYALTLPFLLRFIQDGVSWLHPASLSGWYSVQAVASLLLILIPAWALGFGFPLVLRVLSTAQIPLSIIYGVNTCGGAIGAMLPLWLLPAVGWVAALWITAILGLLVALIAYVWSRREAQYADVFLQPGFQSTPGYGSLFAYAVVGAAALMLEIAWTRLFGMILLRTEYVMAVILAVFLLGIGAGSLLARILRSPVWFDLLPLLGAAFALISLWGTAPLAAWAEMAEFVTLSEAMWMQGVMIAMLTLPVTLLLGAWLPMLNHRLGDGSRLYGANAVGAAMGAIATGFVLVPGLGTYGTVIMAALLLFIAGMTWARRRTWLLLPLLLVLAWPVRQLPPSSMLLPQAQAHSLDLMTYEDALTINHVVQQEDGQRILLTDLQRMDASSDSLAVISQQNQARLPLLLHPQPRTALFLGMGTGISAAGALAFPDVQITAVELSAGAIEAAQQWFAPVNQDVSRRIRVIQDDARRFLLTDSTQYDVIIGDLFHPDLVGRSTLLTRQQFARARAHLQPGGIFVQWLALNQFEPGSLATVLRSFQRVFDQPVYFVDGFRLAMVGRQGMPVQAAATINQLNRVDQTVAAQLTGGEGGWTWLGRYWGEIDPGAGLIQDEWAPVIEFRLPRIRYGGGQNVAATLEWLLQRRADMETAAKQLGIAAHDRESFERAYAATELASRAWLAQLRGQASKGQELMSLAYQANPLDRGIRHALADRLYSSLGPAPALDERLLPTLESVLAYSPEHVEALRLAWSIEASLGRFEQAEEYRARLAQISPLDASLQTKPRPAAP